MTADTADTADTASPPTRKKKVPPIPMLVKGIIPPKLRAPPVIRSPSKVMTHLRTTMIVGLFLLIPVALSFVVLRFLFVTLDEILQPWLRLVLPLPLPGAGIIIIVMLVYVAGLVGGNILGRRVIRLVQSCIQRVPIVNAIYSTSRQLIDSFSGSTNVGFKKVVVIEYPSPGLFSIGFETGSCTNELGKKWVLVYIPTAPLPNSGWIALVPEENVYDSDMTVQAAMQMVLSMGITCPAGINRGPVRSDAGVTHERVQGAEIAPSPPSQSATG